MPGSRYRVPLLTLRAGLEMLRGRPRSSRRRRSAPGCAPRPWDRTMSGSSRRWSGTGCARKRSWLNAMPPGRRKPRSCASFATAGSASPSRPRRRHPPSRMRSRDTLRFTRRRKAGWRARPIPVRGAPASPPGSATAPLPGRPTPGSDWPMPCCHRRSRAAGAATALAQAHAVARRLGARPLLSQIEDLAARARITLPGQDAAAHPGVQAANPRGWPACDRRDGSGGAIRPPCPSRCPPSRRANSTCSPSWPKG